MPPPLQLAIVVPLSFAEGRVLAVPPSALQSALKFATFTETARTSFAYEIATAIASDAGRAPSPMVAMMATAATICPSLRIRSFIAVLLCHFHRSRPSDPVRLTIGPHDGGEDHPGHRNKANSGT